MSIYNAASEANKLVEAVRNLELYSWDEIFAYVPDGEQTKEDIISLIERISDHSGELNNFFK